MSMMCKDVLSVCVASFPGPAQLFRTEKLGVGLGARLLYVCNYYVHM